MIAKKKSVLICVVMTAALCMAFMMLVMLAESVSADDGDETLPYSVKIEGTEGVNDVLSPELSVYPAILLEERTITITDEKTGDTHQFKRRLLDFYDNDWKMMAEYGYYIYENAIWDQDMSVSSEELEGKELSFRFFIYKCSKNGEPLDKNDSVVDHVTDAEVLGVTDPIRIKVKPGSSTIMIKGISYTVFLDERENVGAVSYFNNETGDPGTIKGKVTIVKNVTIDGKKYPVTAIGSPGFNGCSNMTQVVLPDTLKEIQLGSFCDTGLKQITIPDSVKSISAGSIGVKNDKPVPGFVIYAKNNPVAEDYAYSMGFKYIDGKAAKAIKMNMSAKPFKGRKAKLKWKKNKYVTGYQIFKASKKKGKYKKVATIKKPATAAWTSKKMKKGKKVYYKMRAFTKISDKTFYGKWSKVKSVAIK